MPVLCSFLWAGHPMAAAGLGVSKLGISQCLALGQPSTGALREVSASKMWDSMENNLSLSRYCPQQGMLSSLRVLFPRTSPPPYSLASSVIFASPFWVCHSQNHTELGWKKTLRPSSQTPDLTPLCQPEHGTECHIQTSLRHLQGCHLLCHGL